MQKIKTVFDGIPAKLTTLIFISFAFFWFYITIFESLDSKNHEFFANTYWLLALWGGIWGVVASIRWGGLKSLMGKVLILFSLGLLSQVFGQLAYSYYYYVLHIEIPYPSIGDIGFFGSIPIYIGAIIVLAKASGVSLNIKSFQNKIQSLLIPGSGLLLSYLLFLKNYQFDWNYPLIIFLDFGYPMGQAIYISLAILVFLLSKKTLGGIMKPRVSLIVFALVVQFIADYTFLYFFSNGLWYASGPNDLIYLLAYFLMSLALIQLKTVSDQLKANTKTSK